MKLIINISETDYNTYKHFGDKGSYTERIIANGVPYKQDERPKGKWIGDTDYESFQGSYEAYKCSICGYSLHWRDYYSNKYNFCPNCGADMRGDV